MSDLTYQENFFRAHSRALRQDLLSRLSGRSNDLLPFELLMEVLQVHEQVLRPQIEMVPLTKIVGSVGRYRDFTRDFLPRKSAMRERWARVESAMESLEGVPPIELYKLGDVYFVADGNHRVSVARATGLDTIAAYVIEIPVDVDLAPGDSLDQAIGKAERARFLADTRLDRRIQTLDIYFTRPGGFRHLLNHVKIHRILLERRHPEQTPVSLDDAAFDWYQKSYLPIVATVRERQLLSRFPGRTAADLYIWIWGYTLEAYRLFGEQVEPNEAAEMLALRTETPFWTAIRALMSHLGELSRGPTRDHEAMPDWVTRTFEWDDGSLGFLEASSRHAAHG